MKKNYIYLGLGLAALLFLFKKKDVKDETTEKPTSDVGNKKNETLSPTIDVPKSTPTVEVTPPVKPMVDKPVVNVGEPIDPLREYRGEPTVQTPTSYTDKLQQKYNL
jgi:hypothetical protein